MFELASGLDHMNSKRLTGPFAFASGFVLGVFASSAVFFLFYEDLSIARHWRRVNGFNAYLRDSANQRHDPNTGYMAIEVPYDPEPNLAALVVAGELEYVDLVLPHVPRTQEATRYFLQFCEKRPETIIYASGNSQYVAYKPSGDPPLHIKL